MHFYAFVTQPKISLYLGKKRQNPLCNVKLKITKILKDFDKSIKKFALGADTALGGKVLRLIGNVVDVADDTNKIDVIIRISGGTTDINKKFSVTVEEDGEEVDVDFTIRFK